MNKLIVFIACLFIAFSGIAQGEKFEYLDIFNLENVSDPQISPDGLRIVYVRNSRDVLTDRTLSNLWIINFDGTDNQPLTSGNHNDFMPRWSPDGKHIIYKSNKDGSSQFYLRWVKSGAESKLTNLIQSTGSPVWSPDGNYLAFTMFVEAESKSFATMPPKPKGANWNEPPRYIDQLNYRGDGRGYLKQGYSQIFILTRDGGTPRQLTFETYDHRGDIAWSSDGKNIYYSANGHEDGEYDPRNSEIYYLQLDNLTTKQITDRHGPDYSPILSPDGRKIAYLGHDEKYLGNQLSQLYLMDIDGSNSKEISLEFDRDISNLKWSSWGDGLYFQYDNKGNTKLGYINLKGNVEVLADNIGGTSMGRPYGSGSYSVAPNGNYVFTYSTPNNPADLMTGDKKNRLKRLTNLNADLFPFKKLGNVEEIWYSSSYDGKKIQGWICTPPDFDPNEKYPLVLEIHGGPFSNYGDRFSAEIQLYASAGYVVLYTNPRGSTSYGEDFANEIHHNYPGQDYDDLMSGVDAVIKKGFIDENNLFVTGGSGGGVLTAWIVGKTDRFRAAVVAKPVINWYSFVLYSDGPAFYSKYWFGKYPWEDPEEFLKRSPISLVENVNTPTMLLTGESDFRTPIAETEQYYAALKLNKVETAMVRIPGASHGIASRPSNLIAKIVYIVKWFDDHKAD